MLNFYKTKKINIITLWISICSLLLLYFIFFTNDTIMNWSFMSSKTLLSEIARTKQVKIEKELYVQKNIAKTISSNIEALLNINIVTMYQRRVILNQLYYILINNPSYFGVWCSFESNVFMIEDLFFKGQPGHMEDGGFSPYWYKYNNSIQLQTLEETLLNEFEDDYNFVIQTGKGQLMNPYIYKIKPRNITEKDMTYKIHPYEDDKKILTTHDLVKDYIEVMMTTISIPIFKNKDIIGAVGIDSTLEVFQNIVTQMEENTPMFMESHLLDSTGRIIASTEKDILFENIINIHDLPLRIPQQDFIQYIVKEAKEAEMITECTRKNTTMFNIYKPIKLNTLENHWILVVSLPTKQMMKDGNMLIRGVVFSLTMFLLYLTLVQYRCYQK